jgi:hypothetical protein
LMLLKMSERWLDRTAFASFSFTVRVLQFGDRE